MKDKRYKVTDKMEFSIDIYRTINLIHYEQWHKKYFHFGVRLYYSSGQEGATSLYIPFSKIIKKERQGILRLISKYEPSQEFIHMIRATLLIIYKRQQLRRAKK